MIRVSFITIRVSSGQAGISLLTFVCIDSCMCEFLKTGSHAAVSASVELNCVPQDDFKHTAILLPQTAKSWDVKHEPLCPDSSGISTYAYSSRAWALRIYILRYVTYDTSCHKFLILF